MVTDTTKQPQRRIRKVDAQEGSNFWALPLAGSYGRPIVSERERVAGRACATNEASARRTRLTSRLPTQQSIQSQAVGASTAWSSMRRCTRPIVAQALITSAAVPAEWSVGRADPGRGRQGLSVFRVTGSARVGGEPSAGSLILKVLPATKGSPTKWNYPMREPLACTRLKRG